jgi:dTMP kinase
MDKQLPGMLITFEGGEGGGKTTQVARLRERLNKAGRDVIVVREPGGTVISEKIREILLDKQNTSMAYTTEVLLFQAGRAQIYREIVLPSLAAGKVVLMDRSRDSSVVYQGMVRGFGRELIDQLNDISTKKTVPNITFLLDVPPKMGLERQAVNGEINRFEMQGLEFHNSVNAAYLQLAKEDATGRWVIIDASKSLEEVEEKIWEKVSTKLTLI